MNPLNPDAVRFIVVHCSATLPETDIGADEIRAWHLGQGWADIGYHFVVRRSGTIEGGRDLAFQGSHVQGRNHESIGICLVGGVRRDADADGKDDADGPRWDLVPEANFTPEQYVSLESLLLLMCGRFPHATVCGHRDFPGVKKACPSFDVKRWWALRSVGTSA